METYKTLSDIVITRPNKGEYDNKHIYVYNMRIKHIPIYVDITPHSTHIHVECYYGNCLKNGGESAPLVRLYEYGSEQHEKNVKILIRFFERKGVVVDHVGLGGGSGYHISVDHLEIYKLLGFVLNDKYIGRKLIPLYFNEINDKDLTRVYPQIINN